jgi:DNA-binding GntR family transcriptional regulator
MTEVRAENFVTTRQRSHAEQHGQLPRGTGLVNAVYWALHGKLMSLEIPPDSRISVDAVAQELGVSQTPVREALSRLEAQGLVVKLHQIGYRAAPRIDAQRLSQIYDMRILLEPFVAEQAAQRMSDEALTRLVGIDAEMRSYVETGDRDAYLNFARLDGMLHDLIALECGNEVVQAALLDLHNHFHQFRLSQDPTSTERTLAEHSALITAFRHRDGAGAAAAMRDHLEASKRRFCTALE